MVGVAEANETSLAILSAGEGDKIPGFREGEELLLLLLLEAGLGFLDFSLRRSCRLWESSVSWFWMLC